MRRFFIFLLIFSLFALPVSAASTADSGYAQAVVSENGSCDVTMTVTVRLDSVPKDLSFPLPIDARDVTVNGAKVNTTLRGSYRQADLTQVIAAPGTYTLTIRYHLKDVITSDKNGNLTLKLDLLCGFQYAMESFRFHITLPGQPESRPLFTSTYYQDSVETMMTVTRGERTIEGAMNYRLQDHETLTMVLAVTEELFPQPVAKRWSMDIVDLWMLVMAGLALLYWLIAMGIRPPRRLRRTTAPDSITAGEVGCVITGQPVDLTMMVLSWAQMGYLLIQLEEGGRVLLHKRMAMGSERDDFEISLFRKLFGKRELVSGTGHRYARLCRIAAQTPSSTDPFLPHSGDPRIFRVLAAAVGAISGISLATALAEEGSLRILLSILLAAAGFLASLLIQNMGKAFRSRRQDLLLPGISAAVFWLAISASVGEWNVALLLIPAQFLAGLGALYGGRRSETGRVLAGELLGLRKYLKNMSAAEAHRNLGIDPHYYYELAPYAMALGVDRAFARNMGDTPLPQCPYLTTGMDGHMTAKEWNKLLRTTVRSLDSSQQRLALEKLLKR